MGHARIALIEVTDRDGRALRTIDVAAWPLTLGRAIDNDIVIDDPHVAAHHASIAPDEVGRLRLQLGSTINGALVDGRTVDAASGAELASGGAALQLGQTRLRLRLPGEALAAEQPLTAPVPVRRLSIPLLLAALAAIVLGTRWLSLDPGADFVNWLPSLAAIPLVIAIWCAVWALMSKLFQHRFDFVAHLRIALPWLVAIDLVGVLLPQVAATLAQPWLWRLEGPVGALLTVLLVRAHLVHVLPLHRRAATASLATLALAASGIWLAFNERASDRLYGAPYMSTLPLPALRWGGTVPTQQLVAEMAPLAERLQQRVRKSRDENDDMGESDGE